MQDVSHLIPYFHAILVISNPIQFRTRFDLFHKTMAHLRQRGFQHIHVVELVNGERRFSVTQKDNPYHVQLKTEDELWHKENMINLGIAHLNQTHPEWRYVAWIDADCYFTNEKIVTDTLESLQLNHYTQMWETAQDLGPNGEGIGGIHKSFMSQYWRGAKFKTAYQDWHPGFAHAASRFAISHVRIEDRGVLGSGDRHFCGALVGKISDTYNGGVHENYKHMCLAMQERAERYIKRDVGFVRGHLLHYFHGPKVMRGYKDRWKVLVEHQYDPYKDVYLDWQGLYRLEDEKIGLRDDIKKYFRSRNEDCNVNCDAEGRIID